MSKSCASMTTSRRAYQLRMLLTKRPSHVSSFSFRVWFGCTTLFVARQLIPVHVPEMFNALTRSMKQQKLSAALRQCDNKATSPFIWLQVKRLFIIKQESMM